MKLATIKTKDFKKQHRVTSYKLFCKGKESPHLFRGPFQYSCSAMFTSSINNRLFKRLILYHGLQVAQSYSISFLKEHLALEVLIPVAWSRFQNWYLTLCLKGKHLWSFILKQRPGKQSRLRDIPVKFKVLRCIFREHVFNNETHHYTWQPFPSAFWAAKATEETKSHCWPFSGSLSVELIPALQT